jgi:hypothetical protein
MGGNHANNTYLVDFIYEKFNGLLDQYVYKNRSMNTIDE